RPQSGPRLLQSKPASRATYENELRLALLTLLVWPQVDPRGARPTLHPPPPRAQGLREVAAARSPRPRQAADRGGRRLSSGCTHRNVIAFTACLILFTIRSASSVPCLPLNPFMAATIPTIRSETSRIRPTYSTVPWPLSPSRTATIRWARR